MNAKTISRASLAATGSVEVAASAQRFNERERMYQAAKQAALVTGRRLVVVGDPDGGLQTRIVRAYDCGDVCLDLSGCPTCPVGEQVDLVTQQSSIANNTAIVFCSCVLEYVDNPMAVWQEFVRMAGTQENVYLVTVQWWSPAAALYPGAKWRVTRTATGIQVSPVSQVEKVIWWASIGLSAWYAI